MQAQGFEEIIVFILIWLFFVVLIEALVELLLTAEPLEPPRAWISRKSKFVAGLLSCGYCFSVWVAMPAAWILPSPMSLAIGYGFDYKWLIFCEEYIWWLVNGIILHRLSNVFHVRVANVKMFEVMEDEE